MLHGEADSSISSVACFFQGDERGLLSSEGHLWPQATSSLGVEMASGQPPGKLVTLLSDMMTAAVPSEVNAGMVVSRSISPCSNCLSPSVSAGLPMCEGPGTSGQAGAPQPHRPSSVLGDAGPLGTAGLPVRRTLLTSPSSIGDVRVGATSSTLCIWKSKSYSWWSPGCAMWGVTWSGLTSLPSVIMTASLRAAAHHREIPSQLHPEASSRASQTTRPGSLGREQLPQAGPRLVLARLD